MMSALGGVREVAQKQLMLLTDFVLVIMTRGEGVQNTKTNADINQGWSSKVKGGVSVSGREEGNQRFPRITPLRRERKTGEMTNQSTHSGPNAHMSSTLSDAKDWLTVLQTKTVQYRGRKNGLYVVW